MDTRIDNFNLHTHAPALKDEHIFGPSAIRRALPRTSQSSSGAHPLSSCPPRPDSSPGPFPLRRAGSVARPWCLEEAFKRYRRDRPLPNETEFQVISGRCNATKHYPMVGAATPTDVDSCLIPIPISSWRYNDRRSTPRFCVLAGSRRFAQRPFSPLP